MIARIVNALLAYPAAVLSRLLDDAPPYPGEKSNTEIDRMREERAERGEACR